MTEREEKLASKHIRSLLIEFAVPTVIGLFIQGLYNIIDRLFIGWLLEDSVLALGGISIGYPLILLMIAFSVLFTGANTIFSIKLGEKNYEYAKSIKSSSFLWLTLTTLFLSSILVFNLSWIFSRMNIDERIMPYAMTYYSIILGGRILASYAYSMSGFIRSEGSAHIAMYSMISGAIINIILNPIFILVFHWGIAGVACATLLGQATGSFISLYYHFSHHSLVPISVRVQYLRLSLLFDILKVGISPFIKMLGNALAFFVLNIIVISYSSSFEYQSQVLAILGVIYVVSSICIFPVLGISFSMQAIVGYNFGAKQYARVQECVRWAVLFGSMLGIIVIIPIVLFPIHIINLFGLTDISTDLSRYIIQLYFIGLPVVGICFIGSDYFLAIRHIQYSTILSALRRVMLCFIAFIFVKLWGIHTMWYSLPVTDLISCSIIGSILYINVQNITKNKHSNTLLR